MYLRTRLLVGIAVVTLVALAISIIVPLASVRDDVSREIESSTQLARLLHDIYRDSYEAADVGAARTAVAATIRRTEPLRHVKLELVNSAGGVLAMSPTDEVQGGKLARMLLPSESNVTLTYGLQYRGEPLGQLRVVSNPLSEIDEIEQRVFRDLALLALTIVAMAVSIYYIVRRGLMPVEQIQAALTR